MRLCQINQSYHKIGGLCTAIRTASYGLAILTELLHNKEQSECSPMQLHYCWKHIKSLCLGHFVKNNMKNCLDLRKLPY